MAVGSFFFSAAQSAQNSPELHFCFINFFIQPSLLESLVNANLKMFSTRSKKECSNSFSTSNFSFRKSDSWSRCVMHQRPYNFYLIIYLKVFRTERYDVGQDYFSTYIQQLFTVNIYRILIGIVQVIYLQCTYSQYFPIKYKGVLSVNY